MLKGAPRGTVSRFQGLHFGTPLLVRWPQIQEETDGFGVRGIRGKAFSVVPVLRERNWRMKTF